MTHKKCQITKLT